MRASIKKYWRSRLSLFPKLREIEDQLHTAIEKPVNSANLEACRAVLGNFIDGPPAGEALQRRVSPRRLLDRKDRVCALPVRHLRFRHRSQSIPQAAPPGRIGVFCPAASHHCAPRRTRTYIAISEKAVVSSLLGRIGSPSESRVRRATCVTMTSALIGRTRSIS